MTPEEKAKHLIQVFSEHDAWALIATEEIINVLQCFKSHEYGKILLPYWEEVKKQIELV